MERPGFRKDAPLPGIDTLHTALREPQDVSFNETAVAPFLENQSHRKYLEHPIYHRYLKMHKVTTGISGAKELQVIGRELEKEYMPLYKDAAAWSYAEAGLIDTSLSAVERVHCINKAEALWEDALATELSLQTIEDAPFIREPETAYRYALPLAFSPLMKAVVVGNVTPRLRAQAFADTVSFGEAVSDEIKRYDEAGDISSRNMFVGLAHELNALSTLLYMDDPRYIPMPSTARADTGYYHREQTHDIMVLHQHWGTLRKVIPIEIKAKATLHDRRRYKSLIIRGKMHLATEGADPTQTAATYSRFLEGTATTDDLISIERVATEVREMLRLYQQGNTPESLAMRSLTKFQQSKSLEKTHPEIAPY